MPKYENLVQIETKPKPIKKKILARGCDECPCKRGWKKGYPPVMGKVKGKRLFIWAQNPGRNEIRKRKELVGRAGKLLWKELRKFGVKREDCDIQNAVRCLAYERDESGYRVPRMTPTKEEIKCCSLHTEEALEKSKARVHLILGQIAARQVLGREYTKGKTIFWSDTLKAKVIVTLHPSYFLYAGKNKRFKEFQNALSVAADEAFGRKIKAPEGLENFQILLKQDYRTVLTYKDAKAAYKDLMKYVERNRRLSPDFEWDTIDGKKIGLCYGFCPKPGLTYVFFLDHPQNLDNPDRKKVRRIVQKLLEDKHVKKTFHHGCSDVPATKQIYGWKIRGFDYDSELGAYFYDSDLKKYGLSNIANRWFPEFSNYKEVTMPEALGEGRDYKKGRKAGELHYSNVPINKLTLYNGADCDLSKRIELKCQNSAPQSIMNIYRDASFTVSRMQSNGPKLDYVYHGLLEKIFPVKVAELKDKLRKISGHKKLNPNSPPQLLPIIYDEMKLEPITAFIKGKEVEQKNSRIGTLELLNEANPTKFVTKLLEYKHYNSINSKGLKSFKNSADKHNGQLATTWWLTGTITYRLRSGGSSEGEEGKKRGIINLQNIFKDKMVKNLVCSDTDWYSFQEDWYHRIFESFKHKHKNWGKLFEIDEKKKEPTEDAKKYILTLHNEFDRKINWKEFRKLICFLAFDFSQMEVRVLAQMSEDPKLIEYFEKEIDIHSAVGAELTGWTVESIKNDPAIRATIKAIIFAIMYGKKIKGLYQQLINAGVKISFHRVEELWNKFWKRFKRVKELLDSFIEQSERVGYVETLFGTRRAIGEDDRRGTFSENQAVNTPIQGTAHQISVIAMAILFRKMKELQKLQDLKMEVHDQLVWGTPMEDIPEANELGSKLLTEDVITVIKEDFGINWKVPLKADGEAGLRLGTMVKLGKQVNMAHWANEVCLLSEARNRDVRKELEKVHAN